MGGSFENYRTEVTEICIYQYIQLQRLHVIHALFSCKENAWMTCSLYYFVVYGSVLLCLDFCTCLSVFVALFSQLIFEFLLTV